MKMNLEAELIFTCLNDFVQRLILTQRQNTTRIWPIGGDSIFFLELLLLGVFSYYKNFKP